MKALVFGSSGFIGENVCEVLKEDYELHTSSRSLPETDRNHPVDLSDIDAVAVVIERVAPDVVVNCAGITDGEDLSLNEIFTRNILEAVAAQGNKLKRIVICGSAGVYGEVDPDKLPVREDQPLKANSPYGLSKVAEEATALKYREQHGLPVVVARIFNPLGVGMQPRFITSRIAEQVAQVKGGQRTSIELRRLDAERDYIGVRDVAFGVKALLEAEQVDGVYNIGSGNSATNGYIARKIMEYSGLGDDTELTQASDEPEPTVASRADISKIHHDTGWSPHQGLDEVLKEIVDDKS